MKNSKIVYLLRHAAYEGPVADPSLSLHGVRQAGVLGRIVLDDLKGVVPVIWSSTAKRASETALAINAVFGNLEMTLFEKLWSDKEHNHDFEWLEKEIDSFDGKALIIVSHLEYVQDFPSFLGFAPNDARYAQGVCLEDGECRLLGVGIRI